MAPVSTTAHIQNIFNALERLEDFQYSSIQLHTFYKNTIPIKSSVKTRSSAYQVFRTENKGNKDIPKWSDIKNDPIQLSKYQNTAISLNLARGFTDEDPKIINKYKSQQRKLTIQAAIDFEKQKKNTSHTFDDIDINKDGVITREEFDNFNLNKPISIQPKQVVDEPKQVVDETETVVEESEMVVEETETVVDETETVVEESEMVVEETEMVVEETETVVEETETVVEETETVVEETETVVEESETVIEETETVIEETETVIEETETVIEETETVVEETETVVEETEKVVEETEKVVEEKPLYTGKNNSSALSNFKQWILNENELPFNSKIPNSDMKEYKDKYDFDKNKYLLVDECPWFEFIQNNMSIQ